MRYWLIEGGKAAAIFGLIATLALWIHTVAGCYWVAWRGLNASYFVVSAPSGILLQRAQIRERGAPHWQAGEDLKMFNLFKLDPDVIAARLAVTTAESQTPTRRIERNDVFVWESTSATTRNLVVPYWLLIAGFGVIPVIGPIRRRRRALRAARAARR